MSNFFWPPRMLRNVRSARRSITIVSQCNFSTSSEIPDSNYGNSRPKEQSTVDLLKLATERGERRAAMAPGDRSVYDRSQKWYQKVRFKRKNLAHKTFVLEKHLRRYACMGGLWREPQIQIAPEESSEITKSTEEGPLDYVYGIHPVRLALGHSLRTFHRLFVKVNPLTDEEAMPGDSKRDEELREILSLARTRGIPIQMAKRRLLDTLTGCQVHQGICLEASPIPYLRWETAELQDAIQSAAATQHPPLWLFLDRIFDPMNLGSIIRSAYFIGAEHIFVDQNYSASLSPVVSKASSGVMEVQWIHQVDDGVSFLQMLSAEGWDVLGSTAHGVSVSEPKNIVSIDDFEIQKASILVLGNEGRGLHPELLSVCSQCLSVPPGRLLAPGTESLNVSVATGILLFAALRKRRLNSVPVK